MTPVRRKAFTTIEILVAVAIILLLMGLVVVGLARMTGSSKERQTRVALENLRTMLGEFETQTKLGTNRQPPVWLWKDGPTVAGTAPGFNFWSSPFTLSSDIRDLDAPGEVSPNGAHRNVSRGVLNTTLAMAQLAAVPVNRDSLANMGPDQLFYPEWSVDSYTGPGGDHVLMTNDDTGEPVVFPLGCRVRHDGRIYLCVVNEPGSSAPTPGGTSPWKEDPRPVPMFQDGWGNPIIFVPATGLRVRFRLDKDENDPSDSRQTRVVTSTGLIDPNDSNINYGSATYKLPPGSKPFFASAGPDGNFATGDDNLYSFEN